MLTPNQQIGRYKIKSAIGAGGMGEVYLAIDSELERSVALKILPRDVADDSERIQRFQQEAKVVSALNHPNILTIHEIGLDEGTRFIASEFVKGQTLRDKMQSEHLSLETALDIACQIASALDTAHHANIIHRDIKPENVMIRDDGLVKVLDFGLAKLLNESSDAALLDTQTPTRAMVKTQLGIVLGTVYYMSPEQTRGVRPLDGRTDIWSLGVILFEMLSGRRPFTGETPNDVIANILKTEPPLISNLISNSTPELDRIVSKSLKKDREERYQNVKDLALDLKNLKKEMEFSARFSRHSSPHSEQLTIRYDSAHTDSTMLPAMTNPIAAPGISKRKIFAGALASLVAVAGVSFFLLKANFFAPSSTNPSQFKISEVASWSSTSGEIYSVGSFSPDGKMVAFVSTKAGSANIWIKQTTSGEAIQITKDDYREENPVWSPNGEELAFFSSRGGQNGFWRIPVLGGSPKFISTLDNAGSRLRLWSKNNLLYYEVQNELWATDVNAGEPRQITHISQNQTKAASISISPNENQIAYVKVEDEQINLWTENISGTSRKKLVSGSVDIKNSVWHPDNKRIFYSAIVDGTFQIFVTDIYGTPPKQITFSESDSLVLNASADGTRILYGSAKEESDIWGINLIDGKEFSVVSDIDSELWADVSPDGKKLVFQSIKNLSQGNNISSGRILAFNLGSSEPPTELASSGSLPQWSPDGNTVSYLRLVGQKTHLETIRAAGGEQRVVSKEDSISFSYSVSPYHRIQTRDLSWSPDSRKIAYVSKHSSDQQLWLANVDGSGVASLKTNFEVDSNLSCPLWSSEGKRIAVSVARNNPDGTTSYGVAIIDTYGGNSRLLFEQNSFLRLLGWSQTGRELIMATVENYLNTDLHASVSVIRIDIESNKHKELFKLKDTYLFNVHLSPDRNRIAYTANIDGNDNLWIIPLTGGDSKKITHNNDPRIYFSSLAWSPDNNSIFFGKQSRYSLLSMLANFQ